jgi:hypothetical protein
MKRFTVHVRLAWIHCVYLEETFPHLQRHPFTKRPACVSPGAAVPNFRQLPPAISALIPTNSTHWHPALKVQRHGLCHAFSTLSVDLIVCVIHVHYAMHAMCVSPTRGCIVVDPPMYLVSSYFNLDRPDLI